jgi:hypothetical protein
MKKNLELILLIINWVIVAIQAFTIFLYGNSIGLLSLCCLH